MFFKIFISASKAYKVEPLIQPVQVPLPIVGRQPPLHEALDHSQSLVGSLHSPGRDVGWGLA